MKQYESLFTRSKKQPADTAFAIFRAIKTPSGDDYDEPFKQIARNTWDGYESWGFHQPRFVAKYRSDVQRLKNYLDYTFIRRVELEQLHKGVYFKYSNDKNRICFNTGLQNQHQSDIIATFEKSKSNLAKPGCEWVFRGCHAPNDDGYRKFFPQEHPDIAWYSRDSRDFVFDTSYKLEKDTFDHLFDRAKERAGLPNASDEGIRNYLRGTMESLVPKIKRNYKIAIPVYYVKEKRMQLLLPFPSASDKNEFSSFLVERDDSTQTYRLKTIFDLDQAYFSARLITRPDQEWLNP
jgi:Domain of unknown function (DUF3825)